jgi:hypothetical protein
MSKAKYLNGIEPVPSYIMPDRSAPNYELIIEQLKTGGNSPVGSSYYYIKADDNRCSLCRIIHGGGNVFFHEVIDHEKYSISNKDLDEVVKPGRDMASLPEHYQVSPEIYAKLRTMPNIQ